MVIEVISHLPHCLCCWSLVLDRHSGKSSGCIELDVAAIEDVFVVIIDFDILVTSYSLVVVAGHRAGLQGSQLLQLISHFICICVIVLLVFLLFLWFVFGWSWWGRLRASFYIIWWEKTFLGRSFDGVAKPPTVLVGLLDQNLVSLLHSQVRDLFIFLSVLIGWLLFTTFSLFCIFIVKFVSPFTGQLLLVIFLASSL